MTHKTGWNNKICHDAAFVHLPQHTPFVVVIMTTGMSETSAASILVEALSYEIYHQLIAH